MVLITLIYNDKGKENRYRLTERPNDFKHLKKLCTNKLGESLMKDCDYVLHYKHLKILLDKENLSLGNYYKNVDKVEIHIIKKVNRVMLKLDEIWNIVEGSLIRKGDLENMSLNKNWPEIRDKR